LSCKIRTEPHLNGFLIDVALYICPEEVRYLPSFIKKLLGLHKFVHGNFFVVQRFLCVH